MRHVPDLFVTGASRSGTSLLDKLLSLHPAIEVLSQPLPRLYVEIKRRFLAPPQSPVEQAIPLNDLFDGAFRPPDHFTEALHAHRLAPDWLLSVLREMSGFSGQYTHPHMVPEALIPDGPVDLAEFIAHYQTAASSRPGVSIRGSKEVFSEEFVPYFLAVGTRVLVLVRDPRDVVASVFGRRGARYAGTGLPLLFVLRQWRKSVAFALANAHDPGFRLLRYEDLVGDPDTQMASVATWLGCAAFPDDLKRRALLDHSGAPWLSNSSHHPTQGISQDSIGQARAVLPDTLVTAIETLCAPEMRFLGYEVETPKNAMQHLYSVTEPCTEPHPALASYVWGDAALNLEKRRLAGIDAGRFTPRLHLFKSAFDQLAQPPGSTYWTPVISGRASALIHDLARGTRSGAFLLPANICPDVPLAVTRAGRAVRFVDIDPDTLCMQTEAALEMLRTDTDICGVIYARTYGAMGDASDFFSRIRATWPEVLIIDDRCACRPEINIMEDPDSNSAHAVVFSVGRAKYADLGGGGYAFLAPDVRCPRASLCFDPEHAAAVAEWFRAPPADPLANTLEQLNNRWPHWLNRRPSYASWPALRMAVAAECVRIDAHKAQMNAIYQHTIPRDAWLGETFNGWRFNIRTPDKSALLANIFAAGAFASSHYRPTARLVGGPAAPVAEALDRQVVNLFNDRHTDAAQVTQVATLVRDHLQRVAHRQERANQA